MTLKITACEFVRGALHRFGLTRFIDWLRQARGNRFSINKRAPLQDRFAAIYENDLWKLKDGQPSSGAGSSERSAQNVISNLPKVVSELGISSLLDVGCGDFTWMKKIELSCSYTGIDIVPSAVSRNQKEFSNARRNFICLDAITEDIPIADAVLCREVLFHLSFADSMSLIRNVSRAKRKFLLATTDRSTRYNSDIDSGDFRILNLQIPPFNFGRRCWKLQTTRSVQAELSECGESRIFLHGRQRIKQTILDGWHASDFWLEAGAHAAS